MRLRDDFFGVGFGVASMAWATVLPLATFIASRPHLPKALYVASAGVYGLAAFLCHQIPARSFHLWGVQMPVCARCVGIYAGAAGGGAATLLARGSGAAARARSAVERAVSGRAIPSRAARRAVLVSVLPTAATLAWEWSSGQAPAGWLRALAGAPLGITVAMLAAGAPMSARGAASFGAGSRSRG